MISTDFQFDYNVLLLTTCIFSVVSLLIVPFLLCLYYHVSDRRRTERIRNGTLEQAVPFFPKVVALKVWIRMAILILVGLVLITVYASSTRIPVDNTELQNSQNFDYYGSMQVRKYYVETRESENGMLEMIPRLDLKWEIPGQSRRFCLVENHIYEPCLSPLPMKCNKDTCTSSVIWKQQQEVGECVKEALESWNGISLDASNGNMSTRDFEAGWGWAQSQLPTLLFHGNGERCEAYSGEVAKDIEPYPTLLVRLGGTFIVLGMLLGILESASLLMRTQVSHHHTNDDATECCSVDSFQENNDDDDADDNDNDNADDLEKGTEHSVGTKPIESSS